MMYNTIFCNTTRIISITTLPMENGFRNSIFNLVFKLNLVSYNKTSFCSQFAHNDTKKTSI